MLLYNFYLRIYELMIVFCTFVTVGHVFSIIAPKDNEEWIDYYLFHYVQSKQKLDHLVIDGEGVEYHISVVVVTGTWIRHIL